MLYVPFHSSALQCYDRFEGDGWNCSTLKEFNGRTQTEQTWQQKKHFEGHVHQATSKYLQHILSRIQIYIPIFRLVKTGRVSRLPCFTGLYHTQLAL